MATSSGTYIGIDVSKDRLDVAVLGEERVWQVDNAPDGIASLVQQMQALQPELIVVEATGGYQPSAVEGLFYAGLPVAVVNPARVRQFARSDVDAGHSREKMDACRRNTLSGHGSKI